MKRLLVFSVVVLLLVGVEPVFGEKNPGRAVAMYFPEPPVIDGDLAEWDLADPSLVVGFGSNVMTGWISSPEDLEAKIYVGWDEENLYVAVEARDDSVLGSSAWSEYWRIDRINLVFDALNDSTPSYYAAASEWAPDDFWLFFQPFGGAEEAGTVVIMSSTRYENVKDKDIKAVRTDTGYRCEVRVALSELPFVTPEPGTVIGFDVFISDGDLSLGQLTFTEVMWGRFDHDGSGITWQFWKVGALEFAK